MKSQNFVNARKIRKTQKERQEKVKKIGPDCKRAFESPPERLERKVRSLPRRVQVCLSLKEQFKKLSN